MNIPAHRIAVLLGSAALAVPSIASAQDASDMVVMRRVIAPPNRAVPTPAPSPSTPTPTPSPTSSTSPLKSTCEPITQGRAGTLLSFDSAKFYPLKTNVPYTEAHIYCSAYAAENPYKVVSCEWGQTYGSLGTATVGMISRSSKSTVKYETRDNRYASGSCTPN